MTDPKERPILFSGPMVRAILEGRKTQTRRVVKPQPDRDAVIDIGKIATSKGVAYVGNSDSGGIRTRVPCPYGGPGDRLWVRETFITIDNRDGGRIVRYRADGSEKTITAGHGDDDWRGESTWTPSIFMPREYSRLILEITDIRIERLKDIDESDSMAEGVDGYLYAKPGAPGERLLHRKAFAELWDSINAKRGHAWDSNPWVWVVGFGRC